MPWQYVGVDYIFARKQSFVKKLLKSSNVEMLHDCKRPLASALQNFICFFFFFNLQHPHYVQFQYFHFFFSLSLLETVAQEKLHLSSAI